MVIHLIKRLPLALPANSIISLVLWRQLTLSDRFFALIAYYIGVFAEIHFRRVSLRVGFGVFYVSNY